MSSCQLTHAEREVLSELLRSPDRGRYPTLRETLTLIRERLGYCVDDALWLIGYWEQGRELEHRAADGAEAAPVETLPADAPPPAMVVGPGPRHHTQHARWRSWVAARVRESDRAAQHR